MGIPGSEGKILESGVAQTAVPTIKDSGERREFETGSVRDVRVGKGRFDLLSPFVTERLAKWYEAGALKYGDRNWEKGQSIGSFYDSAARHMNKFHQGLKDEDHLIAALWNLSAMVHGELMLSRGIWPKELDDMPDYKTPHLKGQNHEGLS